MDKLINDADQWRISKSGYSIVKGGNDKKETIAKCPYDTTDVKDPKQSKFNTWLHNAQIMCEIYNARLGVVSSIGFQARVNDWLIDCLGETSVANKMERNARILEEALELVQSLDYNEASAHEMVGYVYGRDKGEPSQEVGGVMVSLAALCTTNNIDMLASGEIELKRCNLNKELIRKKQAAKPPVLNDTQKTEFLTGVQHDMTGTINRPSFGRIAVVSNLITEPEWIKNLKKELLMSKMTHNFTLSRDELIELMGGLENLV